MCFEVPARRFRVLMTERGLRPQVHIYNNKQN